MLLPALYDDQRRLLARLAGMLVLSAASVLPLTVQGSSVASAREMTPAAAHSVPSPPGPLTFPTFTITRDPFQSDRVTSNAPSPNDSIGIVLPPNIGAAADDGGVSVRAIVMGARARALVDFGGKVEVLGVGDALGDLKIAAIDARGVVLSDGSRIALEGAR